MNLLLLYIFSIICAYLTIRYLYIHRWKNINPTIFDVIIILIPGINLLLPIVAFFMTLPKIKLNLNTFFKIDKR